MNKGPIQSQGEYDGVILYLTKTTSMTLGINMDEAKKRVIACVASGIMKGGNPESVEYQKRIELFLRVPTSMYGQMIPEEIAGRVLKAIESAK